MGIAAGHRGKVRCGDVVVAQNVYDLEGGRLELRSPRLGRMLKAFRRLRRRLETLTVPERTRRSFEYFDLDVKSWGAEVRSILEAHGHWCKAPTEASRRVEPRLRPGHILSGERLIADGRIPDVAADVHDKLLASEMEGNGFAATMHHLEREWAIVRGISDYGDWNKADGWQAAAAVAAASFCRRYLEAGYRRADEDLAF